MDKEFSGNFIPRSNLVSKEYKRYCSEMISETEKTLARIIMRREHRNLTEIEQKKLQEAREKVSFYNSEVSRVNNTFYPICDIYLIDSQKAKEVCSSSTYEQISTMFQLSLQGPDKRVYIDFDGKYNISGRFPDSRENEV